MENQSDVRHQHLKIKIGVSGAAETGHCGAHAMRDAKELGKEIALSGSVIVSGATTGFPLWACIGAKENGGVSVGLSPASSEEEHVNIYKLPVDYMDLIMYTGFGYPGRDLLFTRSCDAIIIGCGRIGTMHEFAIAFESDMPIGILQGEWDFDQTIKTVLERGHRENNKIIFEKDPHVLVSKIVEMVRARKANLYKYELKNII